MWRSLEISMSLTNLTGDLIKTIDSWIVGLEMGRFSESWEYLFRSQIYLSSMHLQSLHIISNYFPSMLRWYGHLVILRYRYITINKIKSRVFLFFMYFQIMLSRDFQIIISSSTVCFSGNYFVENVTFFIVIWCVLRSFHILPHVKSFFSYSPYSQTQWFANYDDISWTQCGTSMTNLRHDPLWGESD